MLFTSESVAIGHPDKVADQISDAILDAYLSEDPYAKVDCETVVSNNLIVLSGQISSLASVNYQEIVKTIMTSIGYDTTDTNYIINITKQSPDIFYAVNKNMYHKTGAGDQGIMFGYATDETKELMPLPIILAHRLVEALRTSRITGALPFLGIDGKSQVTIEYGPDFQPKRVHTILISAQHNESVSSEDLQKKLKALIQKTIPTSLLDEKTTYLINPSGRFVIGGPEADTGLTGRKQMVDTYGCMARQGGGAFSGKDPTKVDRSAAYMARYIAKNIVAAKLASRCEIQLAYAIGMPYPIAVSIDTFGTGVLSESELLQKIEKNFDLSVDGIITTLALRRPIYLKTAYGGHFGRNDKDFTWENINNYCM